MNHEKNCAELGTWAQVCKVEGEYASLCIGTVSLGGMKYCVACEETAKAAKKKNISIEDLWDSASIVDLDTPIHLTSAKYIRHL